MHKQEMEVLELDSRLESEAEFSVLGRIPLSREYRSKFMDYEKICNDFAGT